MDSKIFKNFFSGLWEIIEVLAIALVIVVVVRTYLVQPFLVSGASMYPTFSDGNYLIIDKLSYRFKEPERGEVIVFHYPKDHSTFYIKRIIGLPGEKIVSENGKIKIIKDNKEQKLNESYLRDSFHDNFSYSLGKDEYFVMGDNRNRSSDSRYWGPVKTDEIVGLVKLRIFPIKDFDLFSAPAYN